MTRYSRVVAAAVATVLVAAAAAPVLAFQPVKVAPGAPGTVGVWSYAGKDGIGTAYAPYGPGRAASRVWFSLARGVLTETMFGLIHQAQLRELQVAVRGAGPNGAFTAFEDSDVDTRIEYLKQDTSGRPAALAYRIVNTDRRGRFQIEKHIFTDPAGDAVFMRVIVRARGGALTPYLLADPQMAGTGPGDRAAASPAALKAWEGDVHLTMAADRPFAKASVGFVGVSDGETQLKAGGELKVYDTTGPTTGNVALTAELAAVPAGGERTYDVVLGFGATEASSATVARAALARGYAKVRADYEAGWAAYLAGLSQLPRLAAASGDGGRLLYASAMVLKAQEDKTHPGALIASLSSPWGTDVPADVATTGYKAVWPRDFYQVASALLAMGDTQTPVRALDYLRTVQVLPGTPGNRGATGWFLQKTHVDGTPEWKGVQMDQTAMPILLGDRLWRMGLVSDAHIRALYATSLKPAADFLVTGGHVDFMGQAADISPPWSPMERWEEQPGYSPSTTAAEITGLVAAADIAQGAGDAAAAARYRAAADAMSAKVEPLMFTTKGRWGDGRYFMRLSPDGRPDGPATLLAKNGKPARPQQDYLDAGFLELVRYGVRRADAPSITATLPKLDDQSLPTDLRVRYDFRFPGQPGVYPGWRRYGDDGYGEDTQTGAGFGKVTEAGTDSVAQRGRVWPIFTGERGHYEIARATLNGPLSDADRARIRETYARGMELFANGGLMIPEQVYDGVGAASAPGAPTPAPGQGAGSATPLAWSHAEYVKLLRSLADGRVWDRYAIVAQRYAK